MTRKFPSAAVVAALAQKVLLLGIAAFFAFAAIPKIVQPAEFAADIENFRLVPWALVPVLAFYLPWLELVLALLVWVARFYRAALLLIATLLLAFSIALASALWRGLDISCGCFGSGSTGVTDALVRNLVLLAACAVLWILRNGQTKTASAD